MDRCTRSRPSVPWPLFDVAATRRIEQVAAATLPPHALMQRAGLAAARLALAIAPHGRSFWIACGPGNNGGDGMEAALQLRQWGREVTLTLEGRPESLTADAAAAWARCAQAGITLAGQPPRSWDLGIDALLGIGQARPLQGGIAAAAEALNAGASPVLALDVPSGLAADSGWGDGVRATHTLALLTLKPGLFTGKGRDAAGRVWLDDLGVTASQEPTAWLVRSRPAAMPRAHATHKGSYGDVAVVGGAQRHGRCGRARCQRGIACGCGPGVRRPARCRQTNLHSGPARVDAA
jgi:hydroxyethylthiazole kinase-like uncharacterized protein yjeF